MFKQKLSLQEYLSIGYVYLVILGIISEVIYFKFLGVDILNYASISDILLSPLGVVTSKPILFILFVVILTMTYLFIMFGMPKMHQKFRNKEWYKKISNIEKSDKKYEEMKKNKGIPFLLIMIMSMFVGMGVGRGGSIKERLKNNNFELDHKVTFSDGIVKNIYIIGQNSMYLFYVLEGEKEVSISPISPNIKSIKNIPKEEE